MPLTYTCISCYLKRRVLNHVFLSSGLAQLSFDRLHVRSFLDHDRPYIVREPVNSVRLTWYDLYEESCIVEKVFSFIWAVSKKLCGWKLSSVVFSLRISVYVVFFCFGFGICIFVYIHIIYYIVSVIHKQPEEGDHKDLRKLILENRSQLVPIEMGIVSTWHKNLRNPTSLVLWLQWLKVPVRETFGCLNMMEGGFSFFFPWLSRFFPMCLRRPPSS